MLANGSLMNMANSGENVIIRVLSKMNYEIAQAFNELSEYEVSTL